VLDSISDAIIAYKADLNGVSFLSPDSRKLVTMVQNRHDRSSGTTLLLQHLEGMLLILLLQNVCQRNVIICIT